MYALRIACFMRCRGVGRVLRWRHLIAWDHHPAFAGQKSPCGNNHRPARPPPGGNPQGEKGRESMPETLERTRADAVIIGAGFSGMHMLKSPRDQLGLKARVYEAGETVGGTWYWNRHPGARCDSDAYIYCFTWDRQLL